MNKRERNWNIPSDWFAHFCSTIIIFGIALASGPFLSMLTFLNLGDPARIYQCALAAGCTGIALLLIARLPLYRSRRYWAVGSDLLDRPHRWYRRAAFSTIGMSILLFLVVWLHM